MKFKTGDRVRYGYGPAASLGTVIAVGEPSETLPARGTNYTVKWDDIDYGKYQPTIYKAADLVRDE